MRRLCAQLLSDPATPSGHGGSVRQGLFRGVQQSQGGSTPQGMFRGSHQLGGGSAAQGQDGGVGPGAGGGSGLGVGGVGVDGEGGLGQVAGMGPKLVARTFYAATALSKRVGLEVLTPLAALLAALLQRMGNLEPPLHPSPSPHAAHANSSLGSAPSPDPGQPTPVPEQLPPDADQLLMARLAHASIALGDDVRFSNLWPIEEGLPDGTGAEAGAGTGAGTETSSTLAPPLASDPLATPAAMTPEPPLPPPTPLAVPTSTAGRPNSGSSGSSKRAPRTPPHILDISQVVDISHVTPAILGPEAVAAMRAQTAALHGCHCLPLNWAVAAQEAAQQVGLSGFQGLSILGLSVGGKYREVSC